MEEWKVELVVADELIRSVVATPEAQQWLNALGGGDNVLQLDCVAMTRIRLQLADELIRSVVAALKQSHPYETPAYEVWQLEDF